MALIAGTIPVPRHADRRQIDPFDRRYEGGANQRSCRGGLFGEVENSAGHRLTARVDCRLKPARSSPAEGIRTGARRCANQTPSVPHVGSLSSLTRRQAFLRP
jgi:hypothetical protein